MLFGTIAPGQPFSNFDTVIKHIGAQGPHSHVLKTEGLSDFLGSEILAKSDFFGSMKDAGIFWGREKKNKDFFGLRKKDQGIFGGMPKK